MRRRHQALVCALLAWGFLFAALGATPGRAADPGALVFPAPISVPDAVLPQGTPRIDVDVTLLLTIDAEGRVTDVVVSKSGGEAYDQAAIAAARQATFTPATRGGEPVPVSGFPVTYPFRKPVRRGRMVNEARERREIEPAPGFMFAGVVVEKGTRTPQPGVPVTLLDPRTGARYEVVTDEDGAFLFDGLPPGELTLDIFTGAYAQLVSKVRVRTTDPDVARDDPPTFYLSPSGLSAYRTVVKEKRPPKAATVIDLTEDELTKVPGTFGDPTRVVATLPGVSRSPFGLGYYVVRGAEFDNTGFFIDDHPALILYHLLGGPGVIHPALVGGLSFYPGGYPARYGRFAAGVIAVDTKDPPRDRWHLDLELDLFRAGFVASVPFDDGKGIVTASFRRSYYELLLPAFNDDILFGFTDYQLRVSYDFSERVRARFIVLGSEDYVEATQEDENGGSSSADLTLGFHRINLAVDVDLSKAVTYTNSVVWEYDHTENKIIREGEDTISGDISGWFAQLRSYVTVRPTPGYSFEAGIDGLYTDIGAALTIPIAPVLGDPRPPDFDPIVVSTSIDNPIYSLGAYLSGDLEVVEGLRLLPGIRLNVDSYGAGAVVTADPKLAVRWRFDEDWTLKAMGAISHQPPQLFQVAQPFGDPTLPPIEGKQLSLGVEWTPTDDWFVSVEGFGQFLDNLAQPTSDVEGDEDSIGRTYFNTDQRGRAFGVEVLVRKAFGGRFYGWLSYTLSRAERDFADGRGWGLFSLDQTHILNLAWTVRLGDEWSLGARFQLTTGNPYYEVVGSRYDADENRYQPLYASETSRLQTYHRLDLRLDKRWRFDTWMFELFLDIQNVYNASNPEAQRYSYDFSLRTDGASLPFLPTLGIRAVF